MVIFLVEGISQGGETMEVDPVQDVSYEKVPPKEEVPAENKDTNTEETEEVPEENGKGENVDFFA